MKRLLLFPAIALAFTLFSCDSQGPSEPEVDAAEVTAGPSFAKGGVKVVNIGYEVMEVRELTLKIVANGSRLQQLQCSIGKKVLGGGGHVYAGGNVVLSGSEPYYLVDRSGWSLQFFNTSATEQDFKFDLYVICGRVS